MVVLVHLMLLAVGIVVLVSVVVATGPVLRTTKVMHVLGTASVVVSGRASVTSRIVHYTMQGIRR